MAVATVTLSGSALLGVEPHYLMGLVETLPVEVKCGAILAEPPPDVLHFKTFFDPGNMSAPPPPAVDYSPKAAASLARMYLNDTKGICVVAGMLHAVGIWTGNDSGTAVVATDPEADQQYQNICGPGDNGCIIARVLDVFRDQGLQLAGAMHRVDGYVAIDWTNQLEVQVALYLFGAMPIGFMLPREWTQNAVWDVTSSPTVGGHLVVPLGYSAAGVKVSSWGRTYLMTWPAFLSRRWLSECYVPLSPDWYGSDRLAPCGVNAAMLAADLIKLGGNVVPDLEPPAPQPPIPGPGPVNQRLFGLNFPQAVPKGGTVTFKAKTRIPRGHCDLMYVGLSPSQAGAVPAAHTPRTRRKKPS